MSERAVTSAFRRLRPNEMKRTISSVSKQVHDLGCRSEEKNDWGQEAEGWALHFEESHNEAKTKAARELLRRLKRAFLEQKGQNLSSAQQPQEQPGGWNGKGEGWEVLGAQLVGPPGPVPGHGGHSAQEF